MHTSLGLRRAFFKWQAVSCCGLITVAAQAGEATIPRREFKQANTYPYVFHPVCYLATQGPVPIRFAPAGPECGNRTPPKAPEPSKPAAKQEPVAAALPPNPTVVAATPPAPAAYPPPLNAPAPPKVSNVDFAKFPPELIDLFKRQQDGADTRNYLFDPIFLPAQPDDLPSKSKAVYQQK